MSQKEGKTQKELVRDFEHHARYLCISAEQINKSLLVELDLSVRRRLAETLQAVVGHSKRMLEGLHISCLHCRRAGGERLGRCVQCGEEVCSFCGRLVDGNPVHISRCALWYRKSKRTDE